MPLHQNAKAMRKQANWQAKNAPVKPKPRAKQAGIKKHDIFDDYRAEKAAYDRSRSAYTRWAMKKDDESQIDHKFRIALGPEPCSEDLLNKSLKEKFIERDQKRLNALKSVDALKNIKKICGPGIPDTRHGYFGIGEFHEYINFGRHIIWHREDEMNDYPLYRFIYREPYKPYLPYYEKNPNLLTDAEFDAQLTTEVEYGIRQVYNSFSLNVRRTLDRVTKIKDALDVEWRRRSSIAACRAYKEDLMANTWHPRRVQKFLDLGGFELLDQMIPGY
jgi:hypothetical protein